MDLTPCLPGGLAESHQRAHEHVQLGQGWCPAALDACRSRHCRRCWSPVTPSRQAGCPTEARPTSASVVLTASKAEPSSGQALRPSGLPPAADGAPSPTRQAWAGADCGPWERAEEQRTGLGGGSPVTAGPAKAPQAYPNFWPHLETPFSADTLFCREARWLGLRASLWETRAQGPASDLLNSLQVPSRL